MPDNCRIQLRRAADRNIDVCNDFICTINSHGKILKKAIKDAA